MRGSAEFKRILANAQRLHEEALGVFEAERGPPLLGVLK
jgi:hypothetical protein